MVHFDLGCRGPAGLSSELGRGGALRGGKQGIRAGSRGRMVERESRLDAIAGRQATSGYCVLQNFSVANEAEHGLEESPGPNV